MEYYSYICSFSIILFLLFISYSVSAVILDCNNRIISKMIFIYFLYLNFNFYSNIFSAFWELDHERFYQLSFDSASLILLSNDNWKIITVLSCIDIILYGFGFDLMGYQKDILTILRFSYNFWEILNFNSGFYMNIIIEVVLLKIQSGIRYLYYGIDGYISTPAWTLILLKVGLVLSGKDELISFIVTNVLPLAFNFFFTLFIIIANLYFFYQFQSNVYSIKNYRGLKFKFVLFINCFDRDCTLFFLLDILMNIAGIAFSYFLIERLRNFFIFLFISGMLMPFCFLCIINETTNSIKCFILEYLSVISSMTVVCFSLVYI